LGQSSLVVLCAGSTLLLAPTPCTRLFLGAVNLFSGVVAKVNEQQPSEVVSFSYWSIKLWFHTEEKLTAVLIIPSSWGFPTGPVRHQGRAKYHRACQSKQSTLRMGQGKLRG
jgi:hypothetical protein